MLEPTAPENVRTGHGVQAPEPAALLNVPATQGVQASSPPAPVYPATHWHALLALLPTADCVRFGQAVQLCSPAPENVFAGHGAHTIDPFTLLNFPAAHAPHGSVLVAFLYFPVSHAPHGPFSGPVYPELQKQTEDMNVLSAGQHTWFSIMLSEHTEQLKFPTPFL